IALGALLLWMTFRPERELRPQKIVSGTDVAKIASALSRNIRRVGVALAAENEDAPMLAEAIALSRTHGAEIFLLHIVEGVGGQYQGNRADDEEVRHDEQYLRDMKERLHTELDGSVPIIHTVLGYGNVRREIVRLSKQYEIDLLVMGGHGHGTISDILRGT